MQRCSEKAFAMCPTRHLCGSREEATFTDHSECAAFNKSVSDKPMTNADRIRAMTDEALAIFLCVHSECNTNSCPAQEMCEASGEEADGLLKWLRQPAEGGGST